MPNQSTHTMLTEREALLRTWDDAWTTGLWAAPWKRALEHLTPAQAAWKPANGRHSIWQIVHHILFWHGYILDRMKGGPLLPDAEVASRNFVEPKRAADAASWRTAVAAFESSHADVRRALADESCDVERFQYSPHHDNYHIGQIMYLRALQGLPPIE